MKDIAQDLGVSVVTVSKVLRNHSDISAETRERVLKRMKELNYRPNWAARTLVTGRTHSIGLIVPDLLHAFFAEIATGLAHRIRPDGYSLIISSCEEDPALERQEIDLLLSRQVDALVVASAQSTPNAFDRCEEHNTPCVLIDRRFAGVRANYVGVDDDEVGALATGHLIACGCRRIAHIRGPELSPGSGRYHGYLAALNRHGIDIRPEYIVAGRSGDSGGDESGYEAMRRLLETDPQPDGVFCFNDPIAIGAMKAILEAGLRIPADIKVVGAGNLHYADFLKVPLTTVDQNPAAIGDRAAGLALNLIESDEPHPPRAVVLTPKLVIRDSTCLAESQTA
jgi:LacI family transcriptional regulator